MAPIAPQSEWPQTTMSPTPSTATAYSTEALTRGLRPVAGDDVAGITDHEEFAGLALGQQLGDHPAVRAGDEQRLGACRVARDLNSCERAG